MKKRTCTSTFTRYNNAEQRCHGITELLSDGKSRDTEKNTLPSGGNKDIRTKNTVIINNVSTITASSREQAEARSNPCPSMKSSGTQSGSSRIPPATTRKDNSGNPSRTPLPARYSST